MLVAGDFLVSSRNQLHAIVQPEPHGFSEVALQKIPPSGCRITTQRSSELQRHHTFRQCFPRPPGSILSMGDQVQLLVKSPSPRPPSAPEPPTPTPSGPRPPGVPRPPAHRVWGTVPHPGIQRLASVTRAPSRVLQVNPLQDRRSCGWVRHRGVAPRVSSPPSAAAGGFNPGPPQLRSPRAGAHRRRTWRWRRSCWRTRWGSS